MAEDPRNDAPNVGRSSGSPPKLFGFYLTHPVAGPTEQRPGLRCQFCNRTFLNSQGLGGHQNAHKRERQLRRFRPQQVQQKVLVPRPDSARNLPPQPPPLFSSSSVSHVEPRWGKVGPPPLFSSSSVSHVEPRWGKVGPPLIMDCPSPTTSTRVHQFHDIIHVVGCDGVSQMEDVNIDLRL